MILTHLNFPESNLSLPVYLIKSHKKGISLQIKEDFTILVRAPIQMDNATILNAIKRKEEWLRKKIVLLKKRENTIQRIEATKKQAVLYRSKMYPLQIKEDMAQLIEFDGTTFFIPNETDFRIALINWYRQKSWEFQSTYLPYWADKINVTYSKHRLSDAQRRLGSCNSQGTISLHWRLIMAPEPVHHYLIVHELCHLVHLNHSPEYWNLVRTYIPDYKILQKWLKDNSLAIFNMI
jgi:predicted metal-dependent hydrolase